MSRILEWNWSPMALACWIGCASWLYVYVRPKKKQKCKISQRQDTMQCEKSNYCLQVNNKRNTASNRVSVWKISYRFITPVFQYIQLSPDHRLQGDRTNKDLEKVCTKIKYLTETWVLIEAGSPTYLQYIRDDISFTLLEERIFVKGWIHLQNLC